jgi:hypothetical protein
MSKNTMQNSGATVKGIFRAAGCSTMASTKGATIIVRCPHRPKYRATIFCPRQK